MTLSGWITYWVVGAQREPLGVLVSCKWYHSSSLIGRRKRGVGEGGAQSATRGKVPRGVGIRAPIELVGEHL